ncbi:collectrin isoform X2 [Hemicordylus capensis]|uniref:collectrin isoform X2 n=1 Tax=Hemicordylus capensis TaxID=884348 RepID=UPI0023031DB8|nr:collectrin isoform X2 [Hemicordylus capensis]
MVAFFFLPEIFQPGRMLGVLLLLAYAWVTLVYAELCKPDAQNAFKVRLSIKTALGDDAYTWDASEEYLFKAMVAFAMRRYSSQEATQTSNVLLCNVTDRVSFWFVVTDSSTNVTAIPRNEVEAAIRMNRNRINSAFLLSDETLQFLKISSTLAPPAEQSTPTWLIVFGVVLCIIVAGLIFLIISGIQQRKRHNKMPEETDGFEEKCETVMTMENGIPCDTLDLKAGQINRVYTAADDERFTPL